MEAIESLKLKLKPVKTREQYKEYLTLEMIKKLHRGLGISAETLLAV